MQRGRILAATTVERMVELPALNWKGDSSRLAIPLCEDHRSSSRLV
jgi:hypothetical protein